MSSSPAPFTALPATGIKSSLPLRVKPHTDLTTWYDFQTQKVKRFVGAPKALPVAGHTSFAEADWWRERVVSWSIFGDPSLDSIANAQILWVVGQICPPDSAIWQTWRLGLSYGYGVALGHLKVAHGQADMAGIAMNVLKDVQGWVQAHSSHHDIFRLPERFPD